jgi:uncharacterized damage-inducible protein DinB
MDERLQMARDAIDRACGGLSRETIARPVEGKWSIGQILEHLTLAFRAHAVMLERPLASGELRARKPTLAQTLSRIAVVDLGYFPRVQAPEMTLPAGNIPPDQSVTAIREALDLVDAALTRVADRFGETARVSNHPYLSGLSVRQWRKFHWRHTIHHMRQVRELGRRTFPRT